MYDPRFTTSNSRGQPVTLGYWEPVFRPNHAQTETCGSCQPVSCLPTRVRNRGVAEFFPLSRIHICETGLHATLAGGARSLSPYRSGPQSWKKRCPLLREVGSPFSRQSLSLGNLFGSHIGGHGFPHPRKVLLPSAAMCSREVEPHVGQHEILQHTSAHVVHASEVVLSIGAFLFGGFAIPVLGRNVVARYASAIEVQEAEVTLCASVVSNK